MSAATEKYSPLQMGLHWLIFLLFGANWLLSDDMGRALRTKLEGGTPEGLVATVHAPIGITILVLMGIRILLRLIQGAPQMPPSGNALMDRAVKLGHLALYAILVLIPASGIAAWGFGIREAGEVHEVLINLGLLLVAGHVAMALYHQFILKDGLMQRMSPR